MNANIELDPAGAAGADGAAGAAVAAPELPRVIPENNENDPVVAGCSAAVGTEN